LTQLLFFAPSTNCLTPAFCIVTFTGGEIFIRPDILEISRARNRTGILVRGAHDKWYLVTKQHMDFIIDNRLRLGGAVSMTVFSHIPEVNDLIWNSRRSLKDTCQREYLQRGGVKVGAKIN